MLARSKSVRSWLASVRDALDSCGGDEESGAEEAWGLCDRSGSDEALADLMAERPGAALTVATAEVPDGRSARPWTFPGSHVVRGGA